MFIIERPVESRERRAARHVDRRASLIITFLGALLQVGCSQDPQRQTPTEQEIHAEDFGTTARVRGRHLYACDNGQRLFVDFKEAGLSLELRPQETSAPTILTAPSQGLQYIGDDATATMNGNKLRIVDGRGAVRVCTKT